MQQLEDDVADVDVLINAQHLRKAPCRRPAHMRMADPQHARPQHARRSTPLHATPVAVRVARAFPPAPVPAGTLANAAFVRRLLLSEGQHVWPNDIAERVTSCSVWPRELRDCATGDVAGCVHALLLPSPADVLSLRGRTSAIRSVDALPYWQSRWSGYRETLCKPLPMGIVAGLSAVLVLGQTANSPAQGATLPSADRSADTTASRSIPADYLLASVATPAPVSTTTTSQPPTTTTSVTPPTTAKPKPVTRPAATVPASTSQCSTSKVAAHACWDGLLSQYSWNTTAAFNVMWCESRGNPLARNPHSTATGLFQILGGPTDAAANVKLAYEMYSKRGWQPWVCKP